MNASENERFRSDVLTPPTWPLDDAIDWIAGNLDPTDVFTNEQLDRWARDAGYVKE